MKRRHFLRLAVGAVLATPFGWLVERALPVRYVEAVRAWCYPGKVVPLDRDSVSRSGKWSG
jgi:hypothetical protein